MSVKTVPFISNTVPDRHVVLWEEGYLQHLGVVEGGLVTGRGDGLPRDAVDLVEGVRPHDALVRRADEDLQVDRLFVVANEL